VAIVAHFEFPEKGSIDKYDRALTEAEELQTQPARSFHVCYELPDRSFGVLDVWDSTEDFEKFGAVLGPVMEKVGLSATPNVYPVHNVM
jgi:hypothetical protein